MVGSRTVARLSLLCAASALIPSLVLAQNVGIAGVARDTSGAVIPGVTVEAESPALIEKVRTVITDDQGRYNIIDLRPGTYSVTFTLPGFATVRHEGVELAGSFTATVNAELKVSTIEETLTVTGETPLVDTRNVVQQRVVTSEVRDELPTGRHTISLTELTPGVTTTGSGHPTGHDVSGVAAARGGAMIHGSRVNDFAHQLDGAPTTLGGGTNSASWQADPMEVQEFIFETGGISAENSAGGVRVNIIPKEGGNRFSGGFYAAFTNDSLVGNNITQELKDLGLDEPNQTTKHWDYDAAGGGPIKQDRLWFFASTRNWGKDEIAAGMYRMIDPRSFVFNPALGAAGNADLDSPAYNMERNSAYGTRITWQASQKHKFVFYVANQPRKLGPPNDNEKGCACAHGPLSGTLSYEAGYTQPNKWNTMFMASWKAPLTSRLLAEFVTTNTNIDTDRVPGPENQYMWDEQIIGVTDSGTGISYRSKMGAYDHSVWSHDTARGALSYVTGSHVAKFGGIYEWGHTFREEIRQPGNMSFTLRNGVPTQITIFNYPGEVLPAFHKVGLFAQDQWTFKRFTVNGGIRYDAHEGLVPREQVTGPNQYAPRTEWPIVRNTPNWKDIVPRMGVVYDLFGTGRTAIKYTLNKYVVNEATTFISSLNPVTFNQSANRPWTDRNGDFIPQESELGTLSNTAFGTDRTTTTVDDGLREGWGVRQANWETAVSLQHQVIEGLSVNLAYTRRWFDNFTVTDNLSVGPSDYDEFCVTAPSDPRLGDVSGDRICGFFDISPAARTRTPNNLRTDSESYGKLTETWQGVDLTMSARLGGRSVIQGGVSTGTQGNNTNNCIVVDSPGGPVVPAGANTPTQAHCNITQPWRPNVKLLGNTEVMWGINVGATYQRIPQPEILANYNVANAQIASGVVQFLNPARTTFSGGSATVSLIKPGTEFLDALNQVDLRLSKTFNMGRARAIVQVDIGNLLNSGAIQRTNNTYGANWLRPSYILEPRIIKPGFRLEF